MPWPRPSARTREAARSSSGRNLDHRAPAGSPTRCLSTWVRTRIGVWRAQPGTGGRRSMVISTSTPR